MRIAWTRVDQILHFDGAAAGMHAFRERRARPLRVRKPSFIARVLQIGHLLTLTISCKFLNRKAMLCL